MCYLALIHKLPVRETPAQAKASFAMITKAMSEKQAANKDGFAFCTNTGQTCRTLNKQEYQQQLTALPMTWQRLLVHFRFGTIGGTTLQNVHLQELDGVRFAHNGTIPSYGTATKSDSLDWFEQFRALIGKVPTDASIKKAWKSIGDALNGRAFLQLADGTVHGFGDWTCYRVGSFLVVSSVALTFSSTETYGDLLVHTALDVPSSTMAVGQWWEFSDTIRYVGKLPEAPRAVGFQSYQKDWGKPKGISKAEKKAAAQAWPLGSRVMLSLEGYTDGVVQPPTGTMGTIVDRRFSTYEYSHTPYQLLLVQWDGWLGGHVGRNELTKQRIATTSCSWVQEWQIAKQASMLTVGI